MQRRRSHSWLNSDAGVAKGESRRLNREDIVMVKTRDGGAIAFSAGQKYSLKLAAGEITDRWADGSPITRAEFENVLAPQGPFEIDLGTAIVASGSLRQ